MSNFFNESVDRVARKEHRCSYCGEGIAKGESYVFQDGNWEGRWFKSRMHPECFTDLCENGDGEYSLYSNERPSKEPEVQS